MFSLARKSTSILPSSWLMISILTSPHPRKKKRFFFIFCCKLIDQKQTMENPIAHIEPNVLFIEQLDPKNNTKLNSLSTPKKFLSFAQFQALNGLFLSVLLPWLSNHVPTRAASPQSRFTLFVLPVEQFNETWWTCMLAILPFHMQS